MTKNENVMYLGPTIRGVVRNGAVFSCGIPKKLSDYADKYGYAKNLIVPVSGAMEAKKALNQEGTVEAVSYREIEKIVKGE